MINFIKEKEIFEEHKSIFQKIFDETKRFNENPFKQKFKYFLAFEYDFLQSELFFENIKLLLKKLNLSYFIYYSVDPTPDKYFYNHGIYSTIKIWDYNTDDDFSEFLMTGDSILYGVDTVSWFSTSNDWAIIGSMDLEIAFVGFTTDKIKDIFLNSFGEDRDIFYTARDLVELYNKVHGFNEETMKKYNTIIFNYPGFR